MAASGSFASLAGALQEGVARGVADYAAQASARLAQADQKHVEKRLADPLARALMATFDRQVIDYATRAKAAHVAGNRATAVRLAHAVERAHKNGQTVRAAIYDTEYA